MKKAVICLFIGIAISAIVTYNTRFMNFGENWGQYSAGFPFHVYIGYSPVFSDYYFVTIINGLVYAVVILAIVALVRRLRGK